MKVDFGRAALDYARYRAGFPDRFYDTLAARGIVPHAAADRALDIATGTGTIARDLARRGWRVDGIDRSAEMLAAARLLAQEEGLGLGLQIAAAEALPFAGGSFALATAGTCWHWFDRPTAAAEARRVLASGDGFVFSFEWADELARWGFVDIEKNAFEVRIPHSHEAWRGRIRASAGVGASLPPDAVARFDAELAALLARDFPDDPLALPHQVMMIVARRG